MPLGTAKNPLGVTRQFPRRHIQGRAITQFKGIPTFAQVLQIGEGGMLLTTAHIVKVGQTMNVQFVLPYGKLNLRCEILYLVPMAARTRGTCVGVRFNGATAGERAIIRAFVTKGMTAEIQRRRIK